MNNNASLKKRDLNHIWHPCSQMKDYEKIDLIPIKKANGLYLYDYDNRSYIDAISSWWVNIFGHSNPKLNKILIDQVQNLEHTIFAGFTHKPAIELAEKLIAITPQKLQKIFFADNGSSAVEIALKMSFHYYKNKNQIRPYFISLQNSYHGETMGALAVGDVELYKATYEEIIIKTIQALSPALVSIDEALFDMENKLKEYKNRVSAVIIEPLVQCAGMMKMYDAQYITKLRSLCDKYDVHLIHDEIAVGFGRTGKMFAFEYANIVPDFLCLSKGITGGYMPLSVVMTTDDVYNCFYCDYNEGKSFLDSHSYTGNALACSIACGVLDIFKEENIIEKNQIKIKKIASELEKFKHLPNVSKIRQQGMIAAIEISNFDQNKRTNLQIYQYALQNGVLLRPLGNVVYFMPPYIINDAEIEKMCNVAYEAIKKTL